MNKDVKIEEQVNLSCDCSRHWNEQGEGLKSLKEWMKCKYEMRVNINEGTAILHSKWDTVMIVNSWLSLDNL